MGWFSAVTKVAKAATKVATAPTRITAALASKVLPKSIGRAVSAAATFNPGTYAVNRVTNTAVRALAPRASAPAPAASPMFSSFQPAGPSFFQRAANAFTNPTAYPSSGGMVSPAVVQAAVAQQAAPYVAPSASTSWAGGGGGGGGGGGAYDGGTDEGGQDYAEDDPTEDMPAEFFDAGADEDGGALGDIDYHAALEGLGDWKSDLLSFGKQAGATVAKQALTVVGNKLTKSATPAPPPPSAGLSTGAKVAIGGAVALGVGYLAFGRRRAPSSSAT